MNWYSVDQGHFAQRNAAPSSCDAAFFGETNLYQNKSGLLEKIRTYFKDNPSAFDDV